jgi:hypothetical protein
VNEHIGPPRQGHNLLGGLAGENDQLIGVRAKLGTIAFAGIGGTADQNAPGVGASLEDCG